MVDKDQILRQNRKKSEINRRAVLSSLAGVGAVSVAGCSGGSSGEGTEAEASGDGTSQTGEARYGGHLYTAFESLVQSLNPMLQTSLIGYSALSQLYSSLVIIDPELELHGDLAREWESNSDATEWTFTLRENATWHHSGDSVTAQDVQATLEKVNNPETGSAGQEVINNINDISTSGDYEVSITLSEGDADVAAKMNNQWLRIMPEEVVNDDQMFEDAKTQDFGSGPFVLEEYQQGNVTRFSRFEDYHLTDEDGNQLPYVDEVTMYIYPDESTMRAEIQNGNLDMLHHGYQKSIYEDLSSSSDLVNTSVPSGLCYPMLMNPNAEPFDDRRVRHAIKHAIDKEAILQVAGRGIGVLGQDNFVGPPHRFYTDMDDPFGQTSQIEEAQALLKEAGYSDGLEISTTLKTPAEFGAPIGPSATVIQDNCSKAGIEFEIENVASDYWLSNIEGVGDFYMGLYAFRIVEDNILRQVLHSEGPWNYGFANEEFDSAIDEARVTTDDERRQELYAEAQKAAQMNAGMSVPFFSNQVGLHQERVGNYQQHPAALKLDIHNTYLEQN